MNINPAIVLISIPLFLSSCSRNEEEVRLRAKLTEADNQIENLNARLAKIEAVQVEEKANSVRAVAEERERAKKLQSELEVAKSSGQQEYATLQQAGYRSLEEKVVALQRFVQSFPMSPLRSTAEEEVSKIKESQERRLREEREEIAAAERRQKERSDLRDRALREAASKFEISVDDVRGMTFYTPRVEREGDPFILPYIGTSTEPGRKPWMLLAVVGREIENLGWDSLLINADGKKYFSEVRPGGGERVGGVW